MGHCSKEICQFKVKKKCRFQYLHISAYNLGLENSFLCVVKYFNQNAWLINRHCHHFWLLYLSLRPINKNFSYLMAMDCLTTTCNLVMVLIKLSLALLMRPEMRTVQVYCCITEAIAGCMAQICFAYLDLMRSRKGADHLYGCYTWCKKELWSPSKSLNLCDNVQMLSIHGRPLCKSNIGLRIIK